MIGVSSFPLSRRLLLQRCKQKKTGEGNQKVTRMKSTPLFCNEKRQRGSNKNISTTQLFQKKKEFDLNNVLQEDEERRRNNKEKMKNEEECYPFAGKKDMHEKKRKMTVLSLFPLSKRRLLRRPKQKKIGQGTLEVAMMKTIGQGEDEEKTRNDGGEWNKVFIPENVIEEILVKLPVRALLRCKCLSKNFLCSISSPPFLECYIESRRRKTPSLTLGFLSQAADDYFENFPIPIQFTPVSYEGWKMTQKDEQQELAFDASLNFLLNAVSGRLFVRASSNGFLLLRRNTTADYYVCNPISRQWVALPYLPNPNKSCCQEEPEIETFICDCSYYPCLEWITYKVVRGVIANKSSPSLCYLDVEIYSSQQGEWTKFRLSSSVFFTSTPLPVEPVISKRGTVCLIISITNDEGFLVFNIDEKDKPLQIIKFPRDDAYRNIINGSWGCLGQSQGCIQYMIYNWCDKFEIWQLNEDEMKWYLQSSFNFTTSPWYSETEYGSMYFQFLAIHPTDPAVVLVRLGSLLVLFELKKRRLHFLSKYPYLDNIPARYRWIPYQWPCWPPLIH